MTEPTNTDVDYVDDGATIGGCAVGIAISLVVHHWIQDVGMLVGIFLLTSIVSFFFLSWLDKKLDIQ